MASDTPTLNADEIRLTQDSGFEGPTGIFTIETDSLILMTDGAQTVHDWMDEVGRALSITAGGDITIGSDINVGGASLTLMATGALTLNSNITAGALSLSGATITLGGSGARTLDGEAITLTGALTSSNALTINAGGRLTLNSAINLGGGTLAITADERIAVPNAMTLITAGAFTIVFTDPQFQDTTTGFVGAFTNLTGRQQTPSRFNLLAAECIIAACMLGTIGEICS